MRSRIATSLQAAGVFCFFAFLYWAMWALPVMPYGSRALTTGSFIVPLLSLAALVVLPLALIGLRRAPTRAAAIRALPPCVAVLAGTAVGLWLGPPHRMQRIAEVAADSMPLVRAIEAFERQEGRPPRALSDLIPRYLDRIPATGMGGYPEWVYITGPDARPYEENAWVLLVSTGGPGINFDMFMYFPNQRYPAYGHGGTIERIGAWGYVHE